jgi:hypothetical protein
MTQRYLRRLTEAQVRRIALLDLAVHFVSHAAPLFQIGVDLLPVPQVVGNVSRSGAAAVATPPHHARIIPDGTS